MREDQKRRLDQRGRKGEGHHQQGGRGKDQGYKRIRIVHGLLVNLAELLFQLRDQCLKSFPGNEISSRSKVPGLHDLHFEFHALALVGHRTQSHTSS